MPTSRTRMLIAVTASAVVAGAVGAVTLTAHAAAAGCAVTYKVDSQWQGGFVGNVTIKNVGDPLNGWTLTWSFTAGQQVTQAWSAVATQNVAAVTARNMDYNAALATNATVNFGFLGSWNNAANPIPASFALNGTTCTGTVTTSPTSGPTTPTTRATVPTTRATVPTTLPTTGPTTPPTTPPAGALTTAHTAGRVKASGTLAQFSWPGVYFEGRFRGTGVGVILNDFAGDYEIQIDGATVATLVMPGQTTRTVSNLSNADHTVRVVKRNESPWSTSEFGGFVAAAGGSILSKPVARTRQIEFIGDSFTAGYGNLSTSRDCTGDQVNRTTNADISFGAITSRTLNADYQINAFSGRGMVRNYNGGEAGTDYRTYYDRALLAVNGDVWPTGTWRPQLVVIGLGINDFSTPVNSGEPWTAESLITAYRTAYHGFIDKLRARYGANTIIVASATAVSGTTAMETAVQRVVQERNTQGDSRVRYWYYDGLDMLGCHWHPSAADHRLIAGKLGTFIATLPLSW